MQLIFVPGRYAQIAASNPHPSKLASETWYYLTIVEQVLLCLPHSPVLEDTMLEMCSTCEQIGIPTRVSQTAVSSHTSTSTTSCIAPQLLTMQQFVLARPQSTTVVFMFNTILPPPSCVLAIRQRSILSIYYTSFTIVKGCNSYRRYYPHQRGSIEDSTSSGIL